jgi:hypothetical protein
MSNWEDAPTSSGGWEDAEAVDSKSNKTPDWLREAGGVAAGGLDVLGASAGGAVALPYALGDVMAGEDPRLALGGVHEAAGAANPMNLFPNIEDFRQTKGHRIVSDTVGKVFDAATGIPEQMAGWGRIGIGKLTGEEEAKTLEAAEKAGATAKLTAEAALVGLRGRPARAGTAAAYRETARGKPTDAQLEQSKKARETYGEWEDAPAPKRTDPSVAGQMELPMEDPNIRSPYNLSPDEIARLEQEMNPPIERRDMAQGELDFGHADRPAMENPRFVLEEGGVGARDRIMSPEAERLQMDTPARVGEMETRVGPPDEALGGMRGQAALEMETRPGDLGQVGIDRARRQAELAKEQPIPYSPTGTPSPVRGPGRRQGGVIDPDLLTFGVSRLLKDKGPRETIKKFLGTFAKEPMEFALRNTRDPKSRETLVWMKPDDFHNLANARYGYEDISSPLKHNIREALKGKEGLDDIPFLQIDGEGRVYGHEGRHRMDVFKEQGIDLVPVRIRHETFRWGERDISERPRLIRAEERAADPSFSIPLPTLLRDQMKQQDVLDRHTPGHAQRGAANLFASTKKDVEKKGAAWNFADQKKLYLYDKRPLKQLVAEEGINPETITDIAARDQSLRSRLDRLLQKGLSNFAVDKAMAILSKDKGPVGKVIKWVVDNQTFINMNSKVQAKQNIRLALDPWKKLKRANAKDVRDVLDVWTANIGKAPLGPESFRTPRQYEAYKAVSEVFTKGWERVNDARQRAGLNTIDFVENYFPAIRAGDYWINIVDGEGKLKWSSAYNTVGEAKRAHALLQKEFGNEFTVKAPSLRDKSQYDLSSFAAFEETIRAMTKDDPIKNAIQKRYAELVGKRGFGKTGIMRKGVEGALGFEPGKKGVANAENVIESYIKRQEAYLANLERAQLQKQLRKDIPANVWEKIPLAKDYIDAYLEKSRGADLDTLPMVKDLTESISLAAGFGRNAPRDFIRNAAGITSLFWLGTVRFLLTQLPQHLNAMPKLIENYQLGDTIKNPAHAYFEGWTETFSPSTLSKEARAWAQKRGYLESTVVELLELRLSDLKGEKWKVVGEAIRWGMGKTEQLAVRTPVFHMFETSLRDQVPNKLERFELAANMMDYYMVHYSREAAPIVYDKLGIVGDAARPLKQFAHNAWGQFFEYAQTAKDQKRMAPLATSIGVQALVGGLKGIIVVAEATAIITVINNMFGTDIPTPEQMLLESKASDTLIFGGYSTALGVDISASMASPSMPQLFSFAPLDFTATAVKDVGSYLLKSVKGTATDQDAMAAMLAVSPAAMRGWIEALYSEPGQPIPKPGAKMRGEFRAPTETDEQIARFGLGLKSLEESRENMAVRAAKQLLARDAERRIGALDAIVDKVKNGEDIPDELLDRYIAQGGNMSQLGNNIKQRMLELDTTWTEFNESRRPSPGQIHRLDRMKQFMDEEVEKDLQNPESKPFQKMSHSEGGRKLNKPHALDREGNVIYRRDDPADMALASDIISTAKRMFPGNPKKQMEYIEDAKGSLDMRRVAPEHFREQLRRGRDSYREM